MTERKALVYLTFNSESSILANLPSLIRYGGETFAVCAVDNASTDNSVLALVSMGIVPIVNDTNLGYTAAINQGIEWALHGDPDWVLLVNPDVKPITRGWVRKLLDVPPDCGIVGARLLDHGMVVHAGGKVTREPYPFLNYKGYGFGKKVLWTKEVLGMSRTAHRSGYTSQYTQQEDVPWVTFAVAAIRRRVFDTIGLLNEDYFLYSSDTEFCFRTLTAGFRICYNPVEFEHSCGGSLRQAPQEVHTRGQDDVVRWIQEQFRWLKRAGLS